VYCHTARPGVCSQRNLGPFPQEGGKGSVTPVATKFSKGEAMYHPSTRDWLCGAALLIAGWAAPAPAAEYSGKGTVTYATSTEATELKDGSKLLRIRFKGVILADDPKSSLHRALQDCSGTNLLNRKGDMQGGGGYCDMVDADGDIMWIDWRSHGTGSDWSVIGGTGKYKAASGGGTTQNILQAKDRLVLTWDGAWKTPK